MSPPPSSLGPKVRLHQSSPWGPMSSLGLLPDPEWKVMGRSLGELKAAPVEGLHPHGRRLPLPHGWSPSPAFSA